MSHRETRDALAGMSGGEPDSIAQAVGLDAGALDVSPLPGRTVALVRIATLIALDAPPASYGRQVAAALESGASPEDILGVLRAVAPQVGTARVVAAAPELMLAMGMSLPEDAGGDA
ncbi:MAG: carboxymuconolactone decarboxylase family protein [Actinomycetota bacterium]|nr:carboxymuconolactone decarboxylase family protein [Actinomycetota bacterium]